MLETVNHTIRIDSTPTFLYFDSYNRQLDIDVSSKFATVANRGAPNLLLGSPAKQGPARHWCDTFDMTRVSTPAFEKSVTDVAHTQRRITKPNSFHESTLTSYLRTLTYELSYGRCIEMAGEMFTVSTRHRRGTRTSNSLPPDSSQHSTARHNTI